jgi:hypothetical protein
VEGVSNDDLVAVAFQGGTSFGYDEGFVGFELGNKMLRSMQGTLVSAAEATLKETMNPSLVHSSTMVFNIFGT